MKKTKQINIYFIIVCLLAVSSFLMIFFSIIETKNTNSFNSQKEQSNNDNNVFFGRKLDFHNDSIEICSKSSENLVKYFETGKTKYVNLYDQKSAENPPDHIKTLLEAFNDDINGEERQDDIVSYLLHFSPILFFYLVAIACVPGWIICIFMAIYRCCCCCCCKKPECRLPFFIIVSIMNLAVIITCIVGLSKTNGIFKGVLNTECSILRFVNEVVEGETKSTFPKWAGIEGVLDILNRTTIEIEQMSLGDTEIYIEEKKNAYNDAKNSFENDLKDACQDISEEPIYKYNNYILDIAKDFGEYQNGNFTNGSYADKWIKQAGVTDKVEISYNVLGEIIHGNTYEAMLLAQYFIEYIQSYIFSVQLLIGEGFLNVSEVIDKYGRLIFNIIFGVLLGISCFIEFLLIFLYFFSSRKYHSCIMHFIIKILIHILWNIFAILMIAIFLFGTSLSLIGSFGEDLVEFFSYILSKKNLQSDSPILLGEDAYLLEVCMNGKGNIWDTLGIEPDLSSIDNLKTLSLEIDLLIEFLTVNEANLDEDPVYDELILEIDERKNLKKNFGLIHKNCFNQTLMFKESISNLNMALEICNIHERWSFTCSEEFPDNLEGNCNSEIDENKCINPFTCYHQLNNRYSSFPTTCSNANNLANIIYTIFNAIDYASDGENPLKENSLKRKASYANNAYIFFLINAKLALEDYTIKFRPLTSLYNNFVGNGTIFGFLNCAFLGKNTKVILYYLNESIGKKFKSLGITIIVIGFAMALSISFTIILVIIISATVKIRQNEGNNNVVIPNDNLNNNEPIHLETNNDNNIITP